MARFLPADHSRGDANTLGGYMAVHDRPAAFEGSDGFSYSVEIMTAETGDPAQPFGAYLLFIRWARVGAQSPEGHLETPFMAFASQEPEAGQMAGTMPLSDVKRALDELIAQNSSPRGARRWWDAMRDEHGEDEQ